MEQVIILLLWVVFILITSYTEGYYWHMKVKGGFMAHESYEHNLWALMRVCVCGGMAWGGGSLWCMIPMLCMFPFFHDGMYYRTRNRISPQLYPEGWYAQSKTSTAWMTKFMPPWFRTPLAAISIVAYFILIIWN